MSRPRRARDPGRASPARRPALLLALTVGSLLLPGGPLPAARAVETIAVTLLEEPRERRRVAGQPIVGLTLIPAEAAVPLPPERLALSLPRAPGLRLCGRIESRDGTYFAWFDEPVSGRAGPAVLELRRARRVPLPRRPPPFLGILVYLAERCDGRTRELLPVTPLAGGPAGAPERPPTRLGVLVNSGGMAATLVVPLPSAPPLRSPCRALEGDDLVVFDRSCELRLEPGVRLADAFLELRRGVAVTRHPLGRQGP